MRIENEILLDYDDVLIRPQRSTLKSRKDVDLSRSFTFGSHSWTGIPVMAANMDTVGTFEVAAAMEKYNMFTCLHKHYELEELFDFFFTPREYTAYSMGINDADLNKWNALKGRLPAGNVKFVCIDVANGYTERFVEFVRQFKYDNPNIVLIAGNVVTAEMTQGLILNGADIVKVGIGPGSVCTTRLQTGVGYPQLSAVIECADAAHGLGGFVIADGGCQTAGDVAKALGAGADFVMLGGMLAGHEESGGETIVEENGIFKVFYGMASQTALDTYNGGVNDHRTSEGKTVRVPFRGPIQDTLQTIIGSLKSTCTYVGAEKLKYLSKRCTFVRVNNTHNKIFE